jgi:hypothetical protein
MIRDLLHHVKALRAISPVSGAGDTTASVSQVIDMQGYSGCLFAIALGAIADSDATFAVLLEESATNFSGAAVADGNMITQTAGTAPEAAASFQYDSDDGVRLLDYTGNGTFRYIRLTITPTANTGAWLHSVVALQYGARHNPAGVTQAP